MSAARQPDMSGLDQTVIEALILRLEETHRRNIQEVRGEVSNLAEHMGAGEASVTSLESRVSELERSRDQHRNRPTAPHGRY